MSTASRITSLVVGALLLGAVATPAAAQTKTLGTFNDWGAHMDGAGGSRACYIGSKPIKAEGDYTQRGDIFAYVSHRPGEKVVGEVSIKTGYTYKPGSEATAIIDGQTFKLFTDGTNAFTHDAAADRAMVAAMKRGRQMVVKGTSARGTTTTDTYSLSGFTAAYDAISKACGSP